MNAHEIKQLQVRLTKAKAMRNILCPTCQLRWVLSHENNAQPCVNEDEMEAKL